MMKMSGGVTSCCVVLFLVLTSVSAVQRLNSIEDLKRIDFGQSVPKHSLILLYWFASTLDMDNNANIRLTFDPNMDYGSHHYGNYEGLLDQPPWGYRYFTIGNIYPDANIQLPDYVVKPRREYMGQNRDRIIIRVRGQRIYEVYITQHYGNSIYDPAHTYQVTTNLLRQIREFSHGENQLPVPHLRNRYGSNADDSYIRSWGHFAHLGLLLFIVIKEKPSLNQRNNRPENHNTSVNMGVENIQNHNNMEIQTLLFIFVLLCLFVAFLVTARW